MQEPYQESFLRHVPLFKNLSAYDLNLIAQASMLRRYNQGETIFRQGESTRGLHVFIDGQALLFRSLPTGQREQLGYIQNGDYINESAIFQDGAQTATLQVLQPTTAILLTRENMANLLSHHPELRHTLGLDGSKEQHLHDVKLKTQRENEEVLLSTRRHWWAYIRYLWLPMLIAIPFWIMIVLAPVLTPILLPISLILVVVAGAYLYFEWANDSVTITDQRVVRITHTILTFTEKRDEIAISSIQEANAEIPPLDPFAWLFRYGLVQLKSAGKEGNFTLDFMPNPQHIQKLIMESHERQMQLRGVRERESMRADLDRWINTQYQAGQAPQVEKPKDVNAAKQKKIEDFWTEGDGPLSPFVSKFPSDTGGIVYRKHWSIWIKAIILPSLWLIAGLAILLLTAFIPFLRDFGIISFAAAMVMLLFGGVWFYFSDWDWRNDYYVISDNNIVIINQRPLWLKNENEQLLLKQVDNVAAETSGIWQRLFKYGDVKVSLVGADEAKIFDNIADPLAVQEEITRRQARIKQQEAAQQQQSQREVIGEYLSLYHETAGYNHQPDYVPPNYIPRAAELRDRSRPDNVPHQQPQQPRMSEGRIYTPNDQTGYDYQGYQQADYQYPAQPQVPISYPNDPYIPQPQNVNPPLPQDNSYPPQNQQQYPPQNPQQGGYNPPPQNYQQGQYIPQQQQNVNPPLPQDDIYVPPQYPQQGNYNPPQQNYQPNTNYNPPPQQQNINPPLPPEQPSAPPPPDFAPPSNPYNINPPLPPRNRDTGRPPKINRRRNKP